VAQLEFFERLNINLSVSQPTRKFLKIAGIQSQFQKYKIAGRMLFYLQNKINPFSLRVQPPFKY